jgi:hypothetical protein
MRRKNDEVNENGDGHIKFRVIEFEIDGGNATLAEGIKALTTALSKSPVTTTVMSQRPALPAATPKRTAGAASEAPAPTEGELFPEEPEADTEEEHIEAPNGNAAPVRPKRPSAPPRTPDVLSDIDLNSGEVSLKDYIAQKSPSGPFEMYATIAVWYKENHGLDEVNDDRIYTAYRFLEEVPPNDVSSILRRLKFNKWFDKGDKKGHYKINIVGLNKVHANFK